LKILSIGRDLSLLESRHRLLLAEGFEAEYVLPYDALVRVKSQRFDLLILSATTPDLDKQTIKAAAAPGVRVLDLDTLVWPRELLQMIRDTTQER
jgi:DNA-binding response OmpR family regulator